MEAPSSKNPPGDRRYLASHEWHQRAGDTVTVGITQFAADELTDITFVALPKIGEKIAAGGRFGDVESVKATSDLYCGMSGTVAETNQELVANPGLINTDPYGKGWIVRVKVASASATSATSAADEFNKLLTVEQYLKQIGK